MARAGAVACYIGTAPRLEAHTSQSRFHAVCIQNTGVIGFDGIRQI